MNFKRWFCLAWLYLIPFAGNAVTPMIAAGNGGSLFLNSDGSVWGTGSPGSGATSPVWFSELANVIAVSTSGATSFALLADGTLWGSGNNAYGQLGDGTTQNHPKFQPVPGLSGIQAVAAASHVLALKEDGTVWAWGRNHMGQLGDGTKVDRYVPAQVAGLTDVIKISSQSEFGSLALKSDGTVWVWGFGGAGDGIASTSTNPGDPAQYRLVPTQVRNLDQVIAIAAGPAHHMALRADGSVWTWGDGSLGQNGTGSLNGELLPVQIPGLDHIMAIEAANGPSAFALTADGTVWAWGNNALGQLGVNGMTYSAVPIQVPGLSDIAAISADGDHVLAMRRDGSVFAWGANNLGQLGNGWFQDQAPPGVVLGPGGGGELNLLTPAPANFNRLPSAQISLSVASGTAPLTVQATAINASDSDGTVTAYYWKSADGQQASGASANFVFAQAGSYLINLLIEDNAGGRRGFTTRVVVASAPVGAVSAKPKVEGNGGVSVALANDGRLLTWGQGWSLSLNPVPNTISHPTTNAITGVVDVALGNGTIHVLLADGSVMGWGGNGAGEVGSGTNTARVQLQLLPGLPPVQALAAKWYNYLALTRDGRVFSWGNNADGALGLGDTETRFLPTEIAGLDNVTAIATGYKFSVALKGDGSVWAWGTNENYQLGDGTQISRNRPIQVPGFLNITKIFVTSHTVFALKTDGTVWVTGYLSGDPGQAGARHVAAYDGIVQIAGSGEHVIARKADGTVWTGGKRSSRALGFESGGDIVGLRQLPGIVDVIWVSGSSDLSMVARRDGTVWAWGRNNYGQLGDGTYADHLAPALVVNESVDGPLDLVPEVPNDIPPDKIPPFFIDASGTVSGPTASVSTTTKFNAADVGKSGAVFVTAFVPVGTLVAAQTTSLARSLSDVTERANSTSVGFVLIQLTSTGWQQVVNGQLIPYASGVLGESLAAQTVLDGTDVSNLGGSEFCVGYGVSAAEMAASGKMRTVATIPTDPTSPSVAKVSCIPWNPATGVWWNPAEGGRGYVIEQQGDSLFFGAYLYDSSGRATWYAAGGGMTGNTFRSTLTMYAAGQTLTGSYVAPIVTGSAGDVSITFNDASRGTLTWPGGTIPIQRFDIVAGGATLTPHAGTPETGIWWNPAESGRGYALEIQAGTMFMGGYMFDAGGNPIWYSSGQTPMTDAMTYVGTWEQYGNGQTMTGTYKSATLMNSNMGTVRIQFTDTQNATLTLPDGRQIPITRFRF